jgi:hypothetical protein
MRLQAVRRPDPLHATMTNPTGFRHRPTGPVRRLTRRLIQGQFDDPLDRYWRQGRLAAGACCVVQQSIDAFGHKAFLPTPDRRLAFAGPLLDRHRANPIGAQQYNPSPPHVLLRAIARTDHILQPFPIRRDEAGLQYPFSSAQNRISATPAESFVSATPLGQLAGLAAAIYSFEFDGASTLGGVPELLATDRQAHATLTGWSELCCIPEPISAGQLVVAHMHHGDVISIKPSPPGEMVEQKYGRPFRREQCPGDTVRRKQRR